MSEDTKLDFYLKHRQQIEDWAVLRDVARQALDAALLSALTAKVEMSGSLLEVASSTVRNVRWRIPEAQTDPAWVELYWNQGQLLRGNTDAAWPFLAVVVSEKADPDYAPTRTRIKEATRGQRALHGLAQEGKGTSSWVWSGALVPVEEPITVDGYVDYCLQKFESAWTDLHPAILRAIRTVPECAS